MKFSENVFPALPRTELLEVDGRENCSTNFVTDNHCRKGVIDHRVLLADSIHFDKKKGIPVNFSMLLLSYIMFFYGWF